LFNYIKETVLGKNDVAQNQSRVASDTVLSAVCTIGDSYANQNHHHGCGGT
jgi:hypothetical protein